MNDDDDNRDDLDPARGIWTGLCLSALLWIAFGALIVGLLGCAAPRPNPDVEVVKISLTAAEIAAAPYIRRPLCGPAHLPPQCSDAATSDDIKRAAEYAKGMVRVAVIADDTESLAKANAAIDRLVAITPK